MNDARPQQELGYDINIRVTANDTSTPKKYSWIEVYRDSSGLWNNLTMSGNIKLDPAFEYNNSNVTLNTVFPAKRDQRTGQVLFFCRSTGSSLPKGCQTGLLASFRFYGTGDKCGNTYLWYGEDTTTKVPVTCAAGWGIGKTSEGKFGEASVDWIEFQYKAVTATSWIKIRKFESKIDPETNLPTDPDPRSTVFEWYPPSYPMQVRIISQLNTLKVAYKVDSNTFAYLKPMPAPYVYVGVEASPVSLATDVVTLEESSIGTVTVIPGSANITSQPSRNTTPFPGNVAISFGGASISFGSPSNAINSAVSTIGSVSLTGTLIGQKYYKGPAYYAPERVHGTFSGASANSAAITGQTKSTGSSIGALACSGQTAPDPAVGSIASFSRVLWGMNPDSYGVGNYVDLRYVAASAGTSADFTTTSTGGPNFFASVTGTVGTDSTARPSWNCVTGWGKTPPSSGTYEPVVTPPPSYTAQGAKGTIKEVNEGGTTTTFNYTFTVSVAIS